jgi:hypothetical protein
MEQLSFDHMHFHEILRGFIKNVSIKFKYG